MNVQSSTDLDAQIPNLSLSPSPGNASSTLVAYIRGIGEYAPNFTNDATVGVYVDGVYRARMSGNLSDLIDIERLEVLRGPQGTLFGRNTTGGALNIVTRRPAERNRGRLAPRLWQRRRNHRWRLVGIQGRLAIAV